MPYLHDIKTKVELISPEPTKETPITVENYPYGFKRTQARYYIETVKGKGQRVIFQTLNPTTGNWNKPKLGTYDFIAVLYRNLENGHVENTGIGHYTDEKALALFLSMFPEEKLSDYQQHALTFLRAKIRANKHVKYTVTTGNLTVEEQAAADAKEKEVKETLKAIEGIYYKDEKAKKGGVELTAEDKEVLTKLGN
jgi:hypothetical protein